MAPLALVVLAAGAPQPAFASAPVSRGAPAVPTRAAPTAKPRVVKRHSVVDQAAAAAVKTAPKVRWPGAGSADLDLTRGARSASIGGLAVSARAVTPAGASATQVPSAVRVAVLDHTAAVRAGIQGQLLTVGRADGVRSAGSMNVQIGYGDFASAFGGDYGARLHLVQLPGCALTTPQKAECQRGTPVTSSTNDTAHQQLAATVQIDGGMTVLAAQAGDTSSQGTYDATKLDPSSKWDVSLASGAFSWSYPLRTPPTPGGLEPQVSLQYNSQSVDGRTSNTNAQGSWIGEGFTYEPGYIERQYKPCADDGHKESGDECWAFYNGSIMLNGSSGDLVKVNDNLWKMSNDDGTKVERLTGTTNGDNDGEYWKATTTDGTQYYFGYNRLPGWTQGKEETNSTWTVPIAGDDAGEPCYKSSGWADSFCDQGWRWNLDYVKDVHGNVIAYYYGKEYNYYAQAAKIDVNGAKYVRGGYLSRIDYGQADGAVYTTNAPVRIRFDTAERCIPSGTITCAESQLTADTANSWPDVPFDRNCAANTHCTIDQATPTFWTRKRLTAITTEVRGDSSWTPVEQWSLDHSFTDNGDGSKTLWLNKINHSGLYGGTASVPPVRFVGIQMPNRIDTDTDMLAPLNRYRLNTIYTDTGAEIQVNYAPADCTASSLPTEGNSTKRCFPVKWNPFGTDTPHTDWFNKYVVAQLIQVDTTGGNPDAVTSYEYANQGFGSQDPVSGAAWRKAEPDGITKDEYRTWSVWRGYPKVIVRTGDQQTLTTRVDHYFFRGMDGDEKPDSGTRTVKVTDDTGAVYTDSDEISGTELETITYNGSAIVSKQIHQPKHWFTQTQTESWGTRKSAIVRTETERALTALSPDAQGKPVWRETKTVSTYDQTWGRVLKVDDLGDISTPDDDQCTTTTYADNQTAWMYRFPKLSERFSVACDKTPNRATQLLASTRTTYDSLAYGAGPTKGDVTKAETLDSDDGTTTKYLATDTVVNQYGQPTKVTDSLGYTTETSYVYTNGLGTQTTVKNPLLQSTITETLPAFGVPTSVTDANSKRTDLSYDPLGRLASVWLPNRSKALGYTPNTKYSYNVRADAPTVITTQKVKNDGSYATTYQLLDSLLRTRQNQSEGPDGGWLLSDTVYNSTGQVALSTGNYFVQGVAGDAILTVPEGSTNGETKYVYDGANRVTDEIFAVAGDERWRTRTVYDGARTSTVPPLGGTAHTTVVNARGQTTEQDEYAGTALTGPATVTRYTYAPNGKMATMTDALGNIWSYQYDQRANLIETDDPDTGKTTSSYDALNRLTSSEDAQHVVTSHVYDKLGRQIELWQGQPVTGTKLSTMVYDTLYKGQLSGSVRYVNGAAYTIAYSQRDSLYRPTKTTYTIPSDAGTELARTYEFGTSYNVDGTLQAVSMPAAGGLPAESVVTTYDSLKRPLSLAGLTSYVVNDAANQTLYSDLGELLQMTLWNGTGKKAWETFSYERGTGRSTEIRLDRQAAPAVDLDAHYKYDDAGNVLYISDTPAGGPVDTQCFSYDGHRRLTEAWSTTANATQCGDGPAATGVGGPAPYHQSWAFDDLGDRRSETTYSAAGDGVTRDYHYLYAGATQLHTLSSVDEDGVNGTSYEYDERGALRSRTSPTKSEIFGWNAEGKLATYTVGGKDTTYVYDADGKRLLQKELNATTLYLGAMQLRLDLGTRVVTGTRFYSFAGKAIATRTPTGLSFTASDLNNTNGCAIDANSGAITWRRTTPYGSTRGTAPTSWPDDKGFVGGTQDASGLVHLGAREYDPTTGRFISVDPVLDINAPQQMNGYSYAAGNPVTMTDPTGTHVPPDDGGNGHTPPKTPPPASPPPPPTLPPPPGPGYSPSPSGSPTPQPTPWGDTLPVPPKRSCPTVVINGICLPEDSPAIRSQNVANGSDDEALARAYYQGGSCEVGAQQIICYQSEGVLANGAPQTIGDVLLYPGTKDDLESQLAAEAKERDEVAGTCNKHGQCLDPNAFGLDLLTHEAAHSEQWTHYSYTIEFGLAYAREQVASLAGCHEVGICNWFELAANPYKGGYWKPPTVGSDGEFHPAPGTPNLDAMNKQEWQWW